MTALTDKEKEELKKLSVDELIDLYDAEKQARAKSEGKFAKERKTILEKFLRGESDPQDEEEDEAEELYNLEKNNAFQKLKRKFF